MICAEIGKGKCECTLFVPYSDQFVINQLYNLYNVISVNYLNEEIMVKVVLDQKGRGQYARYLKED